MLQQHFKAIHECAEHMSTEVRPSLEGGASTPNYSKQSFEQALTRGLHTQLNQLQKNTVGWCYRGIPIVIYKLEGERHTMHCSSSCNTLENSAQWVWVSSQSQSLFKEGYKWCQHCFKSLTRSIENSHITDAVEFEHFVRQNRHSYFDVNRIKLWQSGKCISNLQPNTSEHLTPELDSETSAQHTQCAHCTWQLTTDSPHLLIGEQQPNIKTGSNYCIFCAQDHIQEILLTPKSLRWQGLQERFHFFNDVCENWAHLRFHIDETWHPLLNLLQQRAITAPKPYYQINQGRYTSLVAPLAWPDQKKAVLPDSFSDHFQLPSDWSALTYTDLLASL